MSNKKLAAIIAFIIILVAFFIVKISVISDGDSERYHSLIMSSEASPEQKVYHVGSQHRHDVTRDYWFEDVNNTLMHCRISYANSELSIIYSDEDSPKLIEKMHDVTISMQEELYYILPDGREAVKQSNGFLLVRDGDPDDSESWFSDDTPGLITMQRIRHLDSAEAVYYYNTETFDAQSATFSIVIDKGHDISASSKDATLLMEGIADSVTFSLKKNAINFHAKHLKMKMPSHNEGGS
ncbi:MAG: hypothetical protein HN411_03415 [Waddliaceae bacterium]|jgi:hypothetical protein|nr:hypothetical protein [Waddliaceae bacterium]MBT3578963.1 hypothetical protein [Waddliaceae bacterium]MBT4445104.1 hypothetical protein [Waddliaceae bacterium]MBT6928969.1 hypothetical protein [Waddliaceae bacterium]MBT7264535.1 hypothetical protein [Waddliaceae bacterium]